MTVVRDHAYDMYMCTVPVNKCPTIVELSSDSVSVSARMVRKWYRNGNGMERSQERNRAKMVGKTAH